MKVFNSVEPILSLRDVFESKNGITHSAKNKLVDFIVYCLNPNHYHFILKQIVDGGTAELMKRLNGGYTWYFNKKNHRNGALLQGRYKSRHIFDNETFLELSTYVTLNNKVHRIGGSTAGIVRSSWDEYVNGVKGICRKEIILDQFKDIKEYKKYAMDTLPTLLERKKEEKELLELLLED